jgi:predicted ATPase/DNA-binding SARP family transcriptional activator
VTIQLYGAIAISVDGRQVSPGGRLERAVLAFLAAHLNQAVTVDELLEAVWPDPPGARRSLQVRVANLRRALASTPVTLESVPGGYALVADPDEVDVLRFAARVAAARGASVDERLALLTDQRGSLGGDPLVEFAFDDFAQPVIRADRESRIEACLLAAEALGEQGRNAGAVEILVPLVEREPLHEPLAAALMQAYGASGMVAEALDVYRRLATSLAERGLEASEGTRRLEEAVLLGRLDPTPPRTTGVPPGPDLVGRDGDTEAIVALLKTSRFVTILGPPGVGKTSLAAVVCHQVAADTARRVVWIDLAAASPGNVKAAIAGALGPDPAASLGEIARRLDPLAATLVVLDNCEHVQEEACEAATALVDHTVRLTVLATSRAAAGPGQRFHLDPLATPPPEASAVETLRSPSVELFVRRARSIDPRFDAAANAEAVGDVCRALDGLPLALELAASRTIVLTPRQIHERLDDRFALLTDTMGALAPHHRTLLGTLDWSIDLLTPPARRLLGSLSVFRGGFDLEGAEAVSSLDPPATLDALEELVRHSLVLTNLGTEPARYRLLESVAEAAAGHTDDAERRSAAARHRDHIGSLATRVAEAPSSQEIQRACHRLDEEAPNLRRAVAAALDDCPHVAARIMVDSWRWWHLGGHWQEGATIVRSLLDTAVPADPRLRFGLYDVATRLILFGGDRSDLLSLLDDADALGKTLGEMPRFTVRGLVLRTSGDLPGAIRVHTEEARALEAAGESARAAHANLAVTHLRAGSFDAARGAIEEAIRDAEIHGHVDQDTSPVTLAKIELLSGNHDRAVALADEWLIRARALGLEAGFQVEAMVTGTIGLLRMDRVAEARSAIAEMLPLAVRLGGTHLHMSLLVAALTTLHLGRRDHATALLRVATMDPDLQSEPELAEIRSEIEAALDPAGRSTDDGPPPSMVNALRIAHSVATG